MQSLRPLPRPTESESVSLIRLWVICVHLKFQKHHPRTSRGPYQGFRLSQSLCGRTGFRAPVALLTLYLQICTSA